GIARFDVLRVPGLVVPDHADNARRQVPADRVEVRPAVVVKVGEMRAPADVGQPDAGGARSGPRVLEERAFDVFVEAVGLPAEVGDEYARTARPERVTDGHTHAGARMIAEHSRPRLGRDFFERAVAAVSEEAIGDPIV